MNNREIKVGALVVPVRPSKLYNGIKSNKWIDLPYYPDQSGVVLEIFIDVHGVHFANVLWSCKSSPDFLDNKPHWYPADVLCAIHNEKT